jgi:hypothetical protein
MAIRARGELLTPTDVANLTVQFYNTSGLPANTIGFPQISIAQPSGGVAMPFTSAGISQLDVGKYLFQFTAPFNGPYGVWNDVWQGNVDGNILTETLSFIIENSQLPKIINSDGYSSIGDDPGFNYSQTSIKNINKILKSLKARLNNNGKARSADAYGNVIYVDCNVFSDEMLITFIGTAITDFNQVPYFTFFTFDDTPIIDQFMDILVEGATLSALASQALIERGREFAITDNGVNFTPPTVSELLNTQYSTLLAQYFEKLKYIKNSMRPSPRGLGTLRPLATSPQFMRLRHLRARQII